MPVEGRRRLLEAMVDVAARHGYGGATVARVIKRAGVSRATFYEEFDNRADCLVAAVQEISARALAGLGSLSIAEISTRELLATGLDAVDREPAAARVLLIESLAGPTTSRAAHEAFLSAVDDAATENLASRTGPARIELSSVAVTGGVVGVLTPRLFRGETGGMSTLLDDLEAWVGAYTTVPRRGHGPVDWPALATSIEARPVQRPNPLEVRLPRGRAALPSGVVAGEHRQRIFAAVARLAREHGYAAMTVGDIVATAGIGRDVFYESFRGKQDAFLAAQSSALENSLALAASGYFGAGTWPERVWDAAERLLAYISSIPDLATLDWVEGYAAGAPAIRRSYENRMAYTLFLEEGYRQRSQAEALPRLCSEAITGSLLELMRRRAVAGRVEQIQELLPEVAYVATAPFVGPAAALELLSAKTGRSIPRSPVSRD